MTAAHPLTVVLDTNVVLDWLVFRDPSTASLTSALASGQVRWLATEEMKGELLHVLGRGSLDAWAPDIAHVLDQWQRWAVTVAVAARSTVATGLRCTDADDQKFIDLAVQVRANALLSKDRAVLRLARRATSWGIAFMPAGVWLQRHVSN